MQEIVSYEATYSTPFEVTDIRSRKKHRIQNIEKCIQSKELSKRSYILMEYRKRGYFYVKKKF